MIKYFLFFFFFYLNLYSQTENLLVFKLDSFIEKKTKKVNTNKIKSIREAISNIDKFKNKKLTVTNVDSLYNSASKLVEKEKIPGLLAWVSAEHGAYHYYLGFYNKSLPHFLKSYHLVNKLNNDEIFEPVNVFQSIGYFLGEIGVHDKSIAILKKAVEKADPNSKQYRTFLNVIGRYLYREKDIDNAKNYFNKTLESSNLHNDYGRKSKVLGDFALIAEDNKDYDKAEELWLESIELSKRINDNKNIMYAQLHLGKMYVKIKQAKKAKNFILKAEKYILKHKHLQYFLYQTKKEQLKIAKLLHNEKQELYTRRYLDSLKKVLENKESSTLNKTINWELEQQKFQQKLEKQQIKLQREQLIKRISIVVFVLITLLLFSIHFVSRRKLKIKIANYQGFISKVKIEKLTSEENLAKTKHDLFSYKTYLKEKNKQIEQLEEEIKKIQNETSKDAIDHRNKLEDLLDSHIMTNDNWQKFKIAFTNEHTAFYNKLVEEHKNITETNLRIIFLQKLQLSNTEMSKILGIGIPGVKKAKQRLRKKIADFDNL